MTKTTEKEMTTAEFHEAVLQADNYTCQGLDCPGNCGPLWGHHIILKSQGGENLLSNGITKGDGCHKKPHGQNKPTIDGKRVTGRQYMIAVLDSLIGSPNYRWSDVHEELKRKEGVPV